MGEQRIRKCREGAGCRDVLDILVCGCVNTGVSDVELGVVGYKEAMLSA